MGDLERIPVTIQGVSCWALVDSQGVTLVLWVTPDPRQTTSQD